MYSSAFQMHSPPSTNTYVQSCFHEGKAHVAPKHIPPHLEIIAAQELCVCAGTLHKCHARTG